MLDKRYDHLAVEDGRYEKWVEKGYFTGGKDKSKPPFSLVIPPPNVTGKLHLGHAMDTIPDDIVARYKRMKGYDVVWVPGVDHAGIATQAKVEARLREQGISRYDLGREKFLEVAYKWKEEYAATIHEQWASLGLSVDYTRERFTLDEGLSKAVKKVFVTLYNEGLIYRGERIINWDPELRTALSNIEVVRLKATPFTPYTCRVSLTLSTNGTSFTLRSLQEQEAREIYERLIFPRSGSFSSPVAMLEGTD